MELELESKKTIKKSTNIQGTLSKSNRLSLPNNQICQNKINFLPPFIPQKPIKATHKVSVKNCHQKIVAWSCGQWKIWE